MQQVRFSSDVVVDLIKHSAQDIDVARSAWVSTKGEASKDVTQDEAKISGLINYLMRDRHGCYDSDTDVLTSEGWKNWKDVEGNEKFATLNLETNDIEYQKATRRIRKNYSGTMVKFSMNNIDLLVTPDHKVLAQTRKSANVWKDLALMPASDLLDRSGRFSVSGGNWKKGKLHDPETAALVGFIAADGYAKGTTISFHLHREDKIKWLKDRFNVTEGKCGKFYLSGASEKLKLWAKQTYTPSGDRCFPRELLENSDKDTAEALLNGYLRGDGSVSRTGGMTASTVSRQMVDDLQELVFKCGYAATEQSPILERSSSYGSKPLYKLTIYRERNSRPRIGWTKTDRKKQVSSVEYNGEIHCVTVPNGTLYVRRNGKPVWSGNSPFEHSYFTFYVKAPIFVWREHMRHRIASYNEESGRYAVLKPEFYIPARERNLQQIGKTGHYQFIEGTNDQYAMTKVLFEKQCIDAYQNYEQLLANGIAKEVARIALPLNIYSSAYVTMNARALMNFLSLRQHVEGSHFPSYPQREIEMVAERYEEILKEHMPITYAAFAANGRVAP